LGLTQQDPFFNEAATAVWAVLLRQKLSRLGLTDIGEPYIRRVEQVTLVRMPVRDGGEFSDAKDPILQEMARALNSATHARNLPGGFVTEGGCGAGEVAYRLAPSDQSVRPFVIKLLHFLICKACGINPNAVDSCIGWQEATGRAHLAGSGAYRYLAQWPDGSITNGSFEINDRVISDITTVRSFPNEPPRSI
jgi:hypothetical protein